MLIEEVSEVVLDLSFVLRVPIAATFDELDLFLAPELCTIVSVNVLGCRA